MAKNGQNRRKVVKSAKKRQKLPKSVKIVKNSQNFQKMAKKQRKLAKFPKSI